MLLHTLDAFYRYSTQLEVVLVLPADQIATWEDLARKHSFERCLTVQAGGSTRFESVRNGLDRLSGEGLVAIHDGARPMVTPALIAESFRRAAIHQSAICAVPLKESLRMLEGVARSRAVDRSAFRLIQTPQTFDLALIKEAYRMADTADASDDATVYERAGHEVFLFEGSYDNIKITTPEDLSVAEALIARRQQM